MKGLKDEFSKESAVLFVNKCLISKKDYNKGNIKAPLSELKCSEFKFACTSTHPSKPYWLVYGTGQNVNFYKKN